MAPAKKPVKIRMAPAEKISHHCGLQKISISLAEKCLERCFEMCQGDLPLLHSAETENSPAQRLHRGAF
jgi:hypothetical protein